MRRSRNGQDAGLRRTVLPGRPEGSPEVACTERWTWFRWACSVRASRQVASTCAPAAAVTPESSTCGHARAALAGASEFPARGGGDRDPAAVCRVEERGDAGCGRAAAVVSLVAAFLFLSRRGIVRWLSLAVFVLAPVAVIVVFAFRAAVGGHRVGCGVAARERGRAGGAGRGSGGLADARASGGAGCPASVPDHESEVRWREGREVRPEAQGGGPRRGGVPYRRARAG